MPFCFSDLFLPQEGEVNRRYTHIPSNICNFDRLMKGLAAFQRLSSSQVQGLEQKVIYMPRLEDIYSQGKEDVHLLRVKGTPGIDDILKVKEESKNPTYLISEQGLSLLDDKEKQHPNSIRKLAKNSGSIQGEILEFSRWEETLEDLGYETKSIDFECDFNAFLDAIVKHLKKGNLPLIAFAVNMATGQPDPFPQNPEEREHASLITGYDPYTDQFTLTHWGEIYKVDAVTLFNANQALVKTRSHEYYVKNSRYKETLRNPNISPAQKISQGRKPASILS